MRRVVSSKPADVAIEHSYECCGVIITDRLCTDPLRIELTILSVQPQFVELCESADEARKRWYSQNRRGEKIVGKLPFGWRRVVA